MAAEVFHVTHSSPGDQRTTALSALAAAVKGAKDAVAAAPASGADAHAPGALAAKIAVLQAEAMTSYSSGDYVTARDRLVQVIRLSPRCDPTVRVGLGMCLWKLGHHEPARAAFERALALDPHCAPARTALAALGLSQAEDARGDTTGAAAAAAAGDGGLDAASRALVISNAVQWLQASYIRNAGLPLTLLELSHALLRHWAPLTLSGSPAVAGHTGTLSAPAAATGLPAGHFSPPAMTTRGARVLLFADDCGYGVTGTAAKLLPGQALKVAVPAPRLPTTPANAPPLLVPVRVGYAHECAAAGAPPGTALARIPVSALPPDIQAAHSAVLSRLPGGLEGGHVLALRIRQPWGGPTSSRGGVHAVNAHRSEQLARAAQTATRNPSLRADATYALARAQHAGGSVIEAGLNYGAVLKDRPTFLPASLGALQCKVAQLLNNRGNEAAARQIGVEWANIKALAAAKPDDRSVARVATVVCTAQRQWKEAAEHARKAADAGPGDATAALALAWVSIRSDEPRDLQKALKACEGAIERLQRTGQAVPPAVFNSAAVVAMRLADAPSAAALAAAASAAGGGTGTTASDGAGVSDADRSGLLARAEAHLTRALMTLAHELRPGAPLTWVSSSGPDGGLQRAKDSPQGATLAFNFARLRELQGRLADAEEGYARLSLAAPAGSAPYWAADLRRAVLARARGDASAASDIAEAALGRASAAIASNSSGSGAGAGGGSNQAAVAALRQAADAAVCANILLGQIAEAKARGAGLTHQPCAGYVEDARSRYGAALKVAAEHLQGAPAPSNVFAEPSGNDTYAQLCLANLRFRDLYWPPDEGRYANLKKEQREEAEYK